MSTEGTKGDGMKLYKMNDCDWWAAENLGAALQEMQVCTGVDDDELIDVNHPPREVTREEMERLTFVRDDGTRTTFAEEWDRQSKLTGFEGRPFVFASTEV